MTKLKNLIYELCPNGVDYVALGTVCQISKGTQLNKSEMKIAGPYPVINGGVNPSGYIEQFNQNENTITISQGGLQPDMLIGLPPSFGQALIVIYLCLQKRL